MRQRWNANAKETEEKNTESWQLGIQACVRTLNEKQFAMANIYRVTHQESLMDYIMVTKTAMVTAAGILGETAQSELHLASPGSKSVSWKGK